MPADEVPIGAPLDLGLFREAMAGFPSGVVVAVARDAEGALRGFTASAFCSVSLDPPAVLVCYAGRAESAPAFDAAGHIALSLLRPEHEDLARLFATRGADKFADPAAFAPAAHGLATVSGALAAMVCRVSGRHAAGDHTILVGEVLSLDAPGGDGAAMLHHRRRFGRAE